MALFGARKPRDPWPRPRRQLTSWLRDHRRSAAETLGFVSRRFGTSLLVWLLVGIALALPAGLYLARENLISVGAAWEGRPGLSVYFQLDAEPASVKALARQLDSLASIERVDQVAPEQALKDFQGFAGVAEAIEIIGRNPLPASLRAVLAPEAAVGDLEGAARLARKAAGVEEVVVEKTWLERLLDLSDLVTRLALILGGLFGLGAVLITATSVRLAIESRLEEVRVLKLVGATEAQIRRPFLYFGAFYGLGGALVAAMLIALALLVIEPPLTRLTASYEADLKAEGFDPMFLGILLGVGLFLGMAGARLAARARLRSLDVA
ncbi:MAG: permease-like cell division protein FtsX [Pseudomonadota bacterium]